MRKSIVAALMFIGVVGLVGSAEAAVSTPSAMHAGAVIQVQYNGTTRDQNLKSEQKVRENHLHREQVNREQHLHRQQVDRQQHLHRVATDRQQHLHRTQVERKRRIHEGVVN